MSELFTGITFPQQKVTPSDDAAIRRAALADGILNGCALNYAGSTLTMGAGLLLGCGRQFRHTAVQNWAVTGANSGYARLVLTIDTTRASTKDSFDQIVDTIEYASSLDGFLQLQQDDINEAGTIYQMAICVVSLGAGGITGIVSAIEKTAAAAFIDLAELSNAAAKLDKNGKVKADQASSIIKHMVDVTEYTLTADDMGKMLLFQMSSGTTTVTIPADADMTMFPLGSEFEVNKWNGGLTVNIVTEGANASTLNIRTRDTNETTSISIDGNYGVVALKRIAASKWLAVGDIA